MKSISQIQNGEVRSRMTREEAIAIIRKEYLCVDRDCDIERSCGRCDLMMPSKEPILEAYNMAISALEQEPSGDLISREATLTAFADYVGSGMSMDDYDALWNIVTKMPSVNPQEKTGHWIRQTDDYHDYYECDHCGIAVGLDDIKNYCPNCGARME